MGVPFFPEDTTLMLCGFLVYTGHVRLAPALVTVFLGVLISDLFLYWVGRHYGRKVVTRKWFGRFLSPARLESLEAKFNKRGIFFILIGRHLIGLRTQIFLVSGIMRMSAIKFLVADALTSLLTIAVMVSIGYGGGRGLHSGLGVHVHRAEVIAAIVVLAFLAGYLVLRFFLKRRKSNTGPL
ncbi:MAG: DedA family protein [Nitrospiraceae bacterium]|nr:DedA family protein [Nitrospiraceae bacterium]